MGNEIKIVVVHIPFLLGYRLSGGGIRPQKMIEALRQAGEEVLVISGTHSERAAAFSKLWTDFKNRKVSIKYIYSESSANPTIMTDKKHWYQFRDFWYLWLFAKNGLRVSLFYRDCHWNVPGVISHMPLLKRMILKFLHYLDLFFYLTFVDTLLLPSEEMKKHVPFASKFKVLKELPPGHDVTQHLPLRKFSDKIEGVYVGGVLPPVYNITSLFHSPKNWNVTICTREDEWRKMSTTYPSPSDNVRVVHLAGKELQNLLLGSQVALMNRAHHEYLTFSLPLKFYEALGHELPIVATRNSIVAKKIQNWDIGWITDGDFPTIDPTDYNKKVENIRKIKLEHTWISRAQQLSAMHQS